MRSRIIPFVLAAALGSACGGSASQGPLTDSGVVPDSALPADAGAPVDSAVVPDARLTVDASVSLDAGAPDSSVIDANAPDTGTDSGLDAQVATDAGWDAGLTGVDAGIDASDASSLLCTPGALQCIGDMPQTCVAGAWVSGIACGGITPVCSAGVCGGYTVTGRIRTTVPTPMFDAGIYLVAGGFEVGARTCTSTGLCVTGGILP